jgi:hypothetical protein
MPWEKSPCAVRNAAIVVRVASIDFMLAKL